ncbi:acid-sensing ion channel 5-like [Amphiura filiformis]|uniref:acid-sensing ion channel 5-like n=1 Tax=Amphiura filiformis TaxID=82378 RepID=UPI003B21C2D6
MDDQSDQIERAIERHFAKFYQKTTLEREFAESTTLHGPSNFSNVNKPWWVRLLWVLVFLTCVGVCLWQIFLRVDAYLQFNVNTKVSTQYRNVLEFPAFTICNFNRYQKSKVIAYFDNVFGVSHSISPSFSESNEGGSSTSYHASFDYDLPSNILHPNMSINMSDFQLKTGFQLDNKTLLECTWRGHKCNDQNFTHVFTQYGNCYTFNKNQPFLNANRSGEGSGLHVLINIHQEEYYEAFSGFPEAGIKVLVHNSIDIPRIESLGTAIPPGYHAFMGIRKYEYENLPPPWGVCNRHRVLKYQTNYTYSGCLLECKLKYYIKGCTCKPLGYPGDVRACDSDELSNCIKNVTKRYRAGNYPSCDCPIPCSFSDYGWSISYAAYPNQDAANGTLKLYSVSEEYLRNNFVSLDVYYEELNYQLNEETEAMPYSSLISDIGGQVGLFLGASAITIGEMLEYLARRIKKLFEGNKSDRRQTNTDGNHTTVPLK